MSTSIKLQIKSWLGKVLFEYEKENNTIKDTLEQAVLRNADLSGAVLRGAVLRGAVLRGAVLRGADLSGADLSGAVLSGADLSGADLRGAVLRGAVLRNAVLSGADLRGAVLRGAVLRDTKADFFEILIHSIPEVEGLKQSLLAGKINGSTYTGDCCCLVGTIANTRGCNYTDLTGIKPDSSRPAERFFTNIKEGDTPENNQIAKIVLEWIEEFEHHVLPKPAVK